MKQKKVIVKALKLFIAIASVFIIAIATQEINQRSSSIPIETEPQQAQVERQTEVPVGYTGIYDAAGLQAIADNLAGNYILMADIDMTGVDWTPIGTNFSISSAFTGVFDGNLYTISNLNIDKELTSTGFFGYTTNATIKNLVIKDITVIGYSNTEYIGGLIGYKNNSTIENVKVVGNITASGGTIGGLIGHAVKGTITKCYSVGDITNNGTNPPTLGGLVGRAHWTTISKCYSVMNIMTTSDRGSTFSGGLVGYLEKGYVNNSYSTGNVTAVSTSGTINAGALVGYNDSGSLGDTIMLTYAVGKVTMSTTGEMNCIGIVGKTTSTPTQSFWTPETVGEQYTGSIKKLVASMLHRETFEPANTVKKFHFDFDTIWQIEEGETFPYLQDMEKPEQVNKSLYKYKEFEGKGTESEPFLIKTQEDLQDMKNQLKNTYYKLANDIRGNSEQPFEPIIFDDISVRFDGNNYKIMDMIIESDAPRIGIFSYNQGTIKNLVIENVTVISTNTTESVEIGGLSGYNSGMIENVTVNGTVKRVDSDNKSTYIGGIVGKNNGTIINACNLANVSSKISNTVNYDTHNICGGIAGENTKIIRRSYNKGSVDTSGGIIYTGGVVGRNYANTSLVKNVVIEESYNRGTITAELSSNGGNYNKITTPCAGGVAGHNGGTINNSYNIGDIIAGYPMRVGGTVGYNLEDAIIANTYSAGEVIVGKTTKAGGAIGQNEGTVTNSYWLPETTGQDKSDAGVERKISEALYQEGYENWDFETIWKIEPDGGSLAYLRELERPEGILKDDLTIKIDVTITKYRTGTKAGVSEAIIGLFDSDKNPIVNELGEQIQGSTNDNGIMTFNELGPGTYYYQELVAPEGYIKDDTIYGFTIDEEGNIDYGENEGIIYNDRVKMKESFTITKYKTETETLVSGAVIGIFDTLNNKIIEATTTEDGAITVSGLEVGSYYYKEITAPEGYILNNTKYNFTVNNDGTVTFAENANKIIYNDRVTTKEGFVITKYRAGTETPLAGAIIGLFDENGNKLDEQTTGENGQVDFGRLEVGSYSYQELTPPVAYVLNDTKYHLSVENDGSVRLETGANGIIYNEPIKVDVTINKYKTGTTTPISGATIAVFDAKGNKLNEKVTDANGKVVFNLEVGTYHYKEVSAPEGYVLNSTMYSFTIANDGSVKFASNTNGIIYNKPVQTGVIITKYQTGTETPLAGAIIGLFDQDGNKLQEGTTTERGQVLFENVEVGTYKYQELQAPVGYVRNETIYEVTIGTDGSVNFVTNNGIIYNDRVVMKESFHITKYRTGTETSLAGATIGIFDAAGNKLTQMVTDENGIITVSGLEVGNYYYQELEAPVGYVRNETMYGFNVNDDGTVTFAKDSNQIIYNNRVTMVESFTITKYRAGTETPLAGAVIGIFGANGNKITQITTDESGTITVSGLEVGNYYYQELEAPVGYVLNATKYNFVVDDNGTVTFTENANKIIYNDRVTTQEGFIVTKYQTGSEIPLAGAKIGLFDINGNKLQEKTTGENGQVNFGKLEVGNYYYQELEAPVGYVLNHTQYQFTVENNGTITYKEGTTKIIYNDKVTTENEFVVTKYRAGTETPLAGAVIGLFDENGNKLDEQTTGENGQVNFGKLEVGNYYYQELEAPVGYVLNATKYNFVVDDNGTVTFTENANKIIYNDRVTTQEGFIVTKYQTGSEIPLAGAKIGLFDINGNKLQEKTTGENGQVNFGKLEVGNYYYQELEAPVGYVLNHTQYQFTVENNGTITYKEGTTKIIYNDKVTTENEFVVTKYRAETETPLAGAVIGLFDENGNKLDEQTTGENGQVNFGKLEVGTYSYQELTPPVAYVLNSTQYHFTVENDGSVSFATGANGIIYNEPIRANVTITKYRTGTTTPLAGATIAVFDAKGNKLAEKVSMENGTVIFENLEVGTYHYKELNAPEGYVLNSTMYSFNITNDGTVTFASNTNGIIYNEPVRSDVTITKYRTGTTTPLAGAKIGLFDTEGNKLQEKITEENGVITFENLEVGTYHYKELQAPEGYVLNNHTYEFTITSDGRITYDENNGNLYNDRVTMKESFIIIKYETGTEKPLAGATIGIFDTTNNKLSEAITTENGIITVSGLEVGNYYYQEINAPEGYVLNHTKYNFSVNNDGTVTFAEGSNKVIYNDRATMKEDFTIIKYKAGTTMPLSGATIGIFNAAGNRLTQTVTDENGIVTVSGLKVGNYYYQEQEAPEGYILNHTKYNFTVNNDGTVTFAENANKIIYNDRVTTQNNVVVTKYRTNTETPLAGAVIGLFDKDGNKLQEKTTEENGQVDFGKLEVGNYYYQEQTAPNGYVLNHTEYHFTVENSGSITYGEGTNGIIYNTPIKTNVVITKYRTGTTTPLAGAVIGLFDKDGNPMVANGEQIKGTTTEEGTLTIINLEPGQYSYQELQAPEGYIRNETMYRFTIANDGTITFENDTNGIIYNEPVKVNVTITKYREGTATPLAGAVIAIFDANGNKIDEQTTGENGQIAFNNLEVGTYTYQEQTAPVGYVRNNTMYGFTINNDGTITFENDTNGIIYNTPVTSNVIIMKYRAGTETPLTGATIALFDANGNKLDEKTTSSNGMVLFNNLEVGTYQYKELTAPAGYLLNSTMYQFTINNDGSITYGENEGIIYNEPVRSNVVITKYRAGTTTPLAGAVIGLFDKEGNPMVANGEQIKGTTTEEGTLTIINLEPGQYGYQELEAPIGYVRNETMYHFTIANDGSITFENDTKGIIYNEPIKVDVTITKYKTGTEISLPGATIALFDKTGNKVDQKVTNTKGTVTFTNLEAGKYRYQELEAPAGYVLNSTVYEFTVNADGSINYGESEGKLYNNPVKADVTITKYKIETEIPLPGAVIGVFDENGNKIDEKTTGENGQIIFAGLEVGTYNYQELQAPIGYVLNNTVYTFTVNIDGSITYGDNNGIIYNDVIKSSAVITKYITGTKEPVKGAVIGLFDESGDKLQEETTASNGTVLFENLEAGTYRYQELTAPAGYILNNAVYTFTVNIDGSITYGENNGIIYNDTIKANVIITKRITGTETPLAGAVIGIYDASGNKLTQKTTNETGTVVFENLEVGMYTYKELQAPLGYELNDKTYIVAVNLDGSVHYAQNKGIIYNDLIKTEVTITKYITGTTIQVKGAVIGLFDTNGNKLDEKVTNTNGTVTFNGLTKGTYHYKELMAPAGYILNDTIYTFTINADGSITYGENNGIIYNDVITANVTITKYETDTNIKLPGATIGLFDTAGNKLLEATTNENGTVTFSGLTKGNYYYQELRAPEGYVLNNTKYTLTVDENGNVTYGENNGNLYNDKVVIEEIKGNATILKLETKTNKQLAGAVIGLYDANGNKLDEKVTDENGIVTFTNLKTGTYHYQELQAPNGYVLNDTMYKLTVNEDGSISYVENKGIIYNDKKEEPSKPEEPVKPEEPEEPKDPEKPGEPSKPEEPIKPEPPKDKPTIDNLPNFLPQTGEQMAIMILITIAMSSVTYYGMKLYKQKKQ